MCVFRRLRVSARSSKKGAFRYFLIPFHLLMQKDLKLIKTFLEVSLVSLTFSVSFCCKNDGNFAMLVHHEKMRSSVKNIWRNLTVSQYFRPVVKMSPKPRKYFATVK